GKPTRPPLAETIEHDGNTPTYAVTFHPKLDQVGSQALTVKVEPQPEEKFTDNNSRTVRTAVIDDKAKVPVLAVEARGGFRYLATALARAPTMDVQTVVFQQPRIGRVPEEDLRKAHNPALQLPEGPDASAGSNCTILGDVPPEKPTAGERA